MSAIERIRLGEQLIGKVSYACTFIGTTHSQALYETLLLDTVGFVRRKLVLTDVGFVDFLSLIPLQLSLFRAPSLSTVELNASSLFSESLGYTCCCILEFWVAAID